MKLQGCTMVVFRYIGGNALKEPFESKGYRIFDDTGYYS
jgi:hypothetical protein